MESQEKRAWMLLFLTLSIIGLGILSAQFKVVHGYIGISDVYPLVKKAMTASGSILIALFFYDKNSTLRRLKGT